MNRSSTLKLFIPIFLLLSFSATLAQTENSSIRATVTGGQNAGEYGGEISTNDSQVVIKNMGDSQLLFLKIVHVRADKSTVSFSINTKFSGGPQTIDLSGKMAQFGVLPETIARNNPKYFTTMSMLGSGQLVLEEIDSAQQRAKGTFTIKQGDISVDGSFDVDL